MTAFNVTNIIPNQITGLVATPSVKSVGLTWDAAADAATYEVWRSYTSADPSVDAIRVGIVETNYYTDDTVSASVGAYFWVKAVNSIGTTSIFSNGIGPSNIGVYFNQLNLEIFCGDFSSGGSATISVDNLKAKVFYTTAGGTATDTGLLSFTTTVTQSAYGSIGWTNPGNARIDDTSYATVTTTATNYSESLQYNIADMGVPADATITSVELRIDGKTTNLTHTYITAIMFAANAGSGPSWSFSAFAANNVDEVITLSKTAAQWGLTATNGVVGYGTDPISTGEIVPDYFSPTVKVLNGGAYANLVAYTNGGGSTGYTSLTGTNTTAYGLSGVSGISGSSSTASDIMGSSYGDVAAYSTWYIVAQTGTIQLSGTFSPIPIIVECMSQWYYDTIAVTTGQTVEVSVRFRFRNITDSTEVIREFTLFKQTGTQVYAANTMFTYLAAPVYPNLSITGMKITQNKEYTLYFEVRKTRSGSDTINAHCNSAFLNYSFGR